MLFKDQSVPRNGRTLLTHSERSLTRVDRGVGQYLKKQHSGGFTIAFPS